MNMKTLILSLFAALSVSAQVPKILRTPFTTNYPPIAPTIYSQLSITNPAGDGNAIINLQSSDANGGSGQLNFIAPSGPIWSLTYTTNTLGLLSIYGSAYQADSFSHGIYYGGGNYTNHIFDGPISANAPISVSGSSPGVLNLFGTNNGAVAFTTYRDAFTTNVFQFNLKGVKPGQIFYVYSTNTVGATNFFQVTNQYPAIAFDGAFVDAVNGEATNLNVRSLVGGASLALLVDTNSLVVTNGKVGIGRTNPTNTLDIAGGINSTGGYTNGGGLNIASGAFTVNTSGGASSATLFSAYPTVAIANSGLTAIPGLVLSSGSKVHWTASDILGNSETTLGRLRAGSVGLSNATTAVGVSLGGTLAVSNNAIASAGASETNLITYSVPANTLTNNGDRLKFRFSGRFASTANAKDMKVVWGSETILDTSSKIVNSGAWTIEGEIIRTGNTAQTASAEFHGAGVTLFTTASAVDLAQTNGIATILKMTSTAAGGGDVTNRTMTVEYWPAP